ncbi:hypothetical protein F2Q68_00004460 [Brassica cretica]|uniref:Uncharacterized protein n=1 Tax=Brassica cretica TaxID=69181 RepID=A0A8S9J5S6_BRACR|nr:hypothetical protein F2Q68_00004460 [Brassica cretica]
MVARVGPGVLPSGDLGRLLAGTRRPVSCLGSASTKSAPLAGLLAHSAWSAGSQLISAGRTVRVSGRWSWSCSVASRLVWVRVSGGLVGPAMGPRVHWVLGQGRGIILEGLGNGLGLCLTQTKSIKGAGMQVAERCNPWPIDAHSLQVVLVRGA